MPSSYTASARYVLQATGEDNNTWGNVLNASALTLIDFNVNGWTTKALSGDYSLTTANGATDEARSAMLKFTGAGPFTVTIPSVSKRYDIWNACSAVLTITNTSTAVAIQPGEVVSVVTDGNANIARVQPTDFGSATLTSVGQISGLGAPSSNDQAATKKYVDDAAFAASAGNLPGQAGNNGKALFTNGSSAFWSTVIPLTRTVTGGGIAFGGGALSADQVITVTAAAAADVRTGSDTSKALTASALMTSSAFQSLTDASTIAWNCANGYNATVTLTASGHTVGVPTGLYDGLCISLELVQDATGSRTVSWASIWDFGAAGLPALQITANKADRVFGQYNGRTSKIEASFRKGA